MQCATFFARRSQLLRNYNHINEMVVLGPPGREDESREIISLFRKDIPSSKKKFLRQLGVDFATNLLGRHQVQRRELCVDSFKTELEN